MGTQWILHPASFTGVTRYLTHDELAKTLVYHIRNAKSDKSAHIIAKFIIERLERVNLD